MGFSPPQALGIYPQRLGAYEETRLWHDKDMSRTVLYEDDAPTSTGQFMAPVIVSTKMLMVATNKAAIVIASSSGLMRQGDSILLQPTKSRY